MRYQRTVERVSNGRIFHNESGFFMWDEERELVMQALAIPRGVCLLAGGGYTSKEGSVVIDLHAALGDSQWGITQSPFMTENAKTVAFDHELVIDGTSWRYKQTTHLDIYGRHFDHTDENRLRRGPQIVGGAPDD